MAAEEEDAEEAEEEDGVAQATEGSTRRSSRPPVTDRGIITPRLRERRVSLLTLKTQLETCERLLAWVDKMPCFSLSQASLSPLCVVLLYRYYVCMALTRSCSY